MAGNANPRTQSVKDAMMAEIIVTELSKFTTSHELIMESTKKILSRYNDFGLVIERMDKRDQVIGTIVKDFQLSTEQYAYLTKLSMSIAQKLKEIDENGIRMETESLNKIIKAVEKGNEPVKKQIRWITYGMIAAFVILLLTILI